MVSVNDEYVSRINTTLAALALEMGDVMNARNPRPPTNREDRVILSLFAPKTGHANFDVGSQLATRVKSQGTALSTAVDAERTGVDDFTVNVALFLAETDETELSNISSQEFQSYLPRTGNSTTS